MTRTFTTATDESLVALIQRAHTRLALIAPAITTPVARALAVRMSDLPNLHMTIILDADAEVYRMGYGDPEALEIIRNASKSTMFDLREQPGVRIGIVISDDQTMVYAPVSRNVEAGSTTEEKPNAIVLEGPATEHLAEASGAAEAAETAEIKSEIGMTGMTPERVTRMQEDIKANPPQPFDLTRKLRVFTSAAEFVELKVSNYKLSKRRVALPAEFVGVGDATLKERITGQIRAPLDGIGAQKVKIEILGKNAEEILVDEKFIEKERKEIEDIFTYVIPGKGRVILKRDRSDFDKQIKRFEKIVTQYQVGLRNSVDDARTNFCEQFVKEFAERWEAAPPSFLGRRSGGNDLDRIKKEILVRADRLFSRIVNFALPEVILNYKGIVIEDLKDAKFMGKLRQAMEKAGVDKRTLDQIFQSGDAAAAQGYFKDT